MHGCVVNCLGDLGVGVGVGSVHTPSGGGGVFPQTGVVCPPEMGETTRGDKEGGDVTRLGGSPRPLDWLARSTDITYPNTHVHNADTLLELQPLCPRLSFDRNHFHAGHMP